MKFFIKIIWIFLFSTTILPAQNGATDFLLIEPAGRGLGMGGAFVALTNDATAPMWNPAGLGFARGMQGYISHAQLFKNLSQHDYAAFSLEMSPGFVAGINWVRVSVDDIPQFGSLEQTYYERLLNPDLRSSGEAIGMFSSSESAFIFSAAQSAALELLIGSSLTPIVVPVNISIGMNMKMLQKNLENATASAQSMDFGIIVSFKKLHERKFAEQSFSIGLGLYDAFSSNLNWDTASKHEDTLPFQAKFGLGYQTLLLSNRNILSLSFDQPITNETLTRFGMEYNFQRKVALRLGIIDDDWTAGAGLQFGLIKLDYAFKSHILGATHRIGGGFLF